MLLRYGTSTTSQTSLVSSLPALERRARHRVNIGMLVLARPLDPAYKEEVQTTLNTSRNGVYFQTQSKHYTVGMRVSVILGYAPNDRCNSTAYGQVVRIDRLKDGRFGIAVQIQLL